MHIPARKLACLFSFLPVTLTSGSLFGADATAKHPGSDETQMRYEGAPITIDPGTTKQVITPSAPAIIEDEFAKAKTIFFQRCAGCHGVLRKGNK